MDSKTTLLIGGGAIGLLILLTSSKKSKGSNVGPSISDCPPGFMAFNGTCTKIPDDDEIIILPDEEPTPIPEPKDIPKDEPTQLSAARQAYADTFIKNKPMNELAGPSLWHNYQIWASAKQKAGLKPLYQEWLTNQIYWYIARKEKKSDFDFPSNVNAPLPFLLSKGKKVNVFEYQNGKALEIAFVETDDQFKQRSSSGIILWTQIFNYVKSKIGANNCPVGAYCG